MANGYPDPGETIGHYRVVRRLGGGGMGVVYEALDERLDRPVALKVIAPDLAEDAEFRERFTREAQAQASLDSRHVLQVYAHGEDGGRLWIASQLVPDGDLRSMLSTHGAPPVPVAVDLVAQVSEGLADAHAAGLVHRDIKPANVLLRLRDDDGYTAYLADFGIARRVDGDATGTSHATVGTPSYMAPELHTGGRPGVASDLYSLGCLLWAALTGRAPYVGTSEFEIVTAHREQPIPQLPADATPLAGQLNDVLRRTMAKDPADRPPSAAAVRDRLRAMQGPVPLPPPAPSPRSPRRLGLVLVVLVVLAAVVVGAYVVIGGRDDGGEADGGTTSPSTTVSSSAPTQPPTSSSPAPSGDEDKAVASMATAFASQLGMSQQQAECVARQTIEKAGLENLVGIGMFDDDLAFHDLDLATHPEVKDALTDATLTCAAG